jgi:hypothetical protein
MRCSAGWPDSFSGTCCRLRSKNVGWGRSHSGCPRQPDRCGGWRYVERWHLSPALRGKWSSGSTTSQSFFRDNRMDNGLTGGNKIYGEEDDSTIHRGWGKLKIGPARRLAGDMVWRGTFMEVARCRYGHWLKSGRAVVAVAMEFEVAAMVVGQSICVEEKRGGKGGVVQSCSH